jgi:Gram-negative porin
MRRQASLAALALGVAAPAVAQGGEGDWAVKAEVVVVGAVMDPTTPPPPAGDGLLGSALVEVSRTDTFENGLTLGWLGAARLERDAALRPAFAGALGACPATVGGCPSAAGLSPVAPSTGLAVGGQPSEAGAFAALEAASVSLSGPWGEGILGWDAGVAARLDARAPTVLRRASAVSPGLEATGLGVVRARNDATGVSAKVSYLSPRWLGLRIGASYTPKANQKSADFDPDVDAPGLASAQLEDVWEGALSFARQFADQDLRVRAAVTYSTATSGSDFVAFGDYEAWGAGLELEHDGWTGGLRWLTSNNAWEAGEGDYEAYEAGLVHEIDGWRFGVETGWAKDRLLNLEGGSWQVGVSRALTTNLDLGIAWSGAEADIPVPAGFSVGHRNARNDGLLLELTVRN